MEPLDGVLQEVLDEINNLTSNRVEVKRLQWSHEYRVLIDGQNVKYDNEKGVFDFLRGILTGIELSAPSHLVHKSY
jgi:hypothetical protein